MVSPRMSGGNFTFGLQTVNGQSYTVLQNTNLASSNWFFYTNFIGDGSDMQGLVPINND